MTDWSNHEQRIAELERRVSALELHQKRGRNAYREGVMKGAMESRQPAPEPERTKKFWATRALPPGLQEPAPEPESESACSTHPDAPHGFDRSRSIDEGRYVCECEGWQPPERQAGVCESAIPHPDVERHEKHGGR